MLRQSAESWRSTLISLRAQVEAQLDFSDEGDVGAELMPEFYAALTELRRELEDAVRSSSSGETIREGLRVAIVGRPNAGKSSLMNALARREVAIVTEEPGTTRDVLEVQLDLDGYLIRLFDTAGFRAASSVAEQEGLRRAEETLRMADLALLIEEYGSPTKLAPAEWDLPSSVSVVRVVSKADLAVSKVTGWQFRPLTGEGLSGLLQMIGSAAAASAGAETAILTRARHHDAVAEALSCLQDIDGSRLEVAAHLLRTASDAIGRLSGRIDIEDVLDRVFAEFCIGK
jgi:tRNA modification GTPase